MRKLGLLILGTACVLSPATSLRAAAAWDETASIHGLTKALVALSPTVSPEEAQVLSVTVHEMSLQLAREYGVNGDPAYHNFLINIGKAQRGYCAHYCRDMGMKLRTMPFKTLVLHWGAAYARASDENNGIVVTAVDQPFLDGIVLDAWRMGGKLFWCKVRDDKEYEVHNRNPLGALGPMPRSGVTAWQENLQESAWLQGKVDIVPKATTASVAVVKSKPSATPGNVVKSSPTPARSVPKTKATVTTSPTPRRSTTGTGLPAG